MAQWINGFEKLPTFQGLYFVKRNGEKHILRLDEFPRRVDTAETFFWLDESEEEKKLFEKLRTVNSIEEFAKLDRKVIAEKLLTPFDPVLAKSVVSNSLDKYYLRIIAQLRKQISEMSKKENGPLAVPKAKRGRQPLSRYDFSKEEPPENSLLDRIRLLNDNPFIEIK